MTTRTRAPRATHRYVTNPETGHVLRLDRSAAGPTSQAVYLLVENGGLVELGHVTMVERGIGFAHPVPALPRAGWPCTSFTSGAVELDQRIRAVPVTTYALELNGD